MLVETQIISRQIRLAMCVDENEIARASLVIIKNDLHAKPYGLLEDVWVDPLHRNKGNGKAMVSAIIERAKREECYKLIATSRFGRTNVHETYRKLGFLSLGFEFRMNL